MRLFSFKGSLRYIPAPPSGMLLPESQEALMRHMRGGDIDSGTETLSADTRRIDLRGGAS